MFTERKSPMQMGLCKYVPNTVGYIYYKKWPRSSPSIILLRRGSIFVGFELAYHLSDYVESHFNYGCANFSTPFSHFISIYLFYVTDRVSALHRILFTQLMTACNLSARPYRFISISLAQQLNSVILCVSEWQFDL